MNYNLEYMDMLSIHLHYDDKHIQLTLCGCTLTRIWTSHNIQ
jgi:hypothetical protein